MIQIVQDFGFQLSKIIVNLPFAFISRLERLLCVCVSQKDQVPRHHSPAAMYSNNQQMGQVEIKSLTSALALSFLIAVTVHVSQHITVSGKCMHIAVA